MAITPAQEVSNLQQLTQKFQALQTPAQSITIISGPLIIVGQGPFPQIIAGFADIVSTATTAIAQSQGSSAVTEKDDVDKLLIADVTLVAVAQQTLNILIGKAGLFTTVPFIGQPVAAVLRQVEGVMDTIQFGLIDRYKSKAQDLQLQAGSLSNTLNKAIASYEVIDELIKMRAEFMSTIDLARYA